MVKSLSVMGITDSDFPMSSISGRANLLLTTSIGGGVYAGIKKGTSVDAPLYFATFPLRESDQFTASFSALPARNEGTLAAAIVISLPV